MLRSLIVVLLDDLMGPEIPFKLGDPCRLLLLPLLMEDRFFLHGEFPSRFVVTSIIFNVLSFGELEDLAFALADSVAAM